MTTQEAQAVAQQLGEIPVNDEKLQKEMRAIKSQRFCPTGASANFP